MVLGIIFVADARKKKKFKTYDDDIEIKSRDDLHILHLTCMHLETIMQYFLYSAKYSIHFLVFISFL